ncbi:hypothetical protein DID88_003734 [Monilinia fructigena]|uniref:hydroxyethylthiazole kinase n=1 Tax=Monilinia fructigena TaxID=38457 RepID=A0A395IU72_9HELO|nr:hypothetical protein DID88_003734 [Monilinia fructigena]
MAFKNVDYSLYLVTDSTPAITCYILLLTQKYNVPLLINDRIDVALAVACEGVHVGQDDMDLTTARVLLGKDAIIGVTVSNIQEALTASESGADYLGIGTMFATPTKTNTKDIIGTAGTKEILDFLHKSGSQSAALGKQLDGVAIVSAIIAAQDAEKAASELSQLIWTPPPFASAHLPNDETKKDPRELLLQVPGVIAEVAKKTPLSHNMTNLVVQNLAANVALAIGASPIMANYGEEATGPCKTRRELGHTIRKEDLFYLIPVGCGATAVRRSAVKALLASGYFDAIKGNEGEIKDAISGSLIQQRGVDSGASTLTPMEKAIIVRDLALRERNVVVMTGMIDILSDGVRTLAVSNGHEILGRITGSGCVLGTIISAMLAVNRGDKLLAVLSALLLYEIAAEIAVIRDDVKGPGTFVPALIDELYIIQKANSQGDLRWLERSALTNSPNIDRPALFICDIQEKFRKTIWEYEKVITTTQKMIKASDILHIPIFATTQNRARLGETCVELSIPNAVEHADKMAFSMWIPSISRHFNSATPSEVIIVGIESHICVTQTTLDLLANGHKVYVLADGSVIYEVMGDASIPEFKAIATIVKESSASSKDVMSTLLSKM